MADHAASAKSPKPPSLNLSKLKADAVKTSRTARQAGNSTAGRQAPAPGPITARTQPQKFGAAPAPISPSTNKPSPSKGSRRAAAAAAIAQSPPKQSQFIDPSRESLQSYIFKSPVEPRKRPKTPPKDPFRASVTLPETQIQNELGLLSRFLHCARHGSKQIELGHKKLGDEYAWAVLRGLGTASNPPSSSSTTAAGADGSNPNPNLRDAIDRQRYARDLPTLRDEFKGPVPPGDADATGTAAIEEEVGELLEEPVESINLCDNRLSDQGLERVLQTIRSSPQTRHIHTLDISQNSLRRRGCQELCLLAKSLHRLEKLGLADLSLGDACVCTLARTLQHDSPALTSLNLQSNKIGDAGATSLSHALTSPSCLVRDLALGWNEIRSRGAVAIFQSLTQNSRLQKLDMQWNAIGTQSDENRSAARALSALVALNTALVHLDLSHNGITAADCLVISAGLQANHSLMGLHMLGNAGNPSPSPNPGASPFFDHSPNPSSKP